MRRRSMNYLIWSTTALVALAALPGGFAQEASGSADHGVARISVINGDVSVRRGEAGEWMAAVVNAPLVSGDRIATGPGSRAEVQFDYGNLIRLAGDSEVNIADLGNNRYQLQVARGTVTYRVLRDSGGQAEIATPNISVRPAERGSYRITVGDGETYVTARSGQAEIYSPRGVETLEAGQTIMVRGAADQPEFQVVAAAAPDEWDAWNDSRDRQLESTKSYRYVSRDIYGAEDLDSYGRWVSTPDYGYVWAPTVAAGWAPYRDGRWVWDDWYGWTWVSYDPWGWAPYHYGRWFYGSVGWCWYPGPVYQSYYWSPALVAFFGWGGGGIGFGFSNIGWVPLGPREPFYPWWGHGYRGYGRGGFFNRNIVNINVFNSYRNARFNGYTAVSAGDFGRGRWHNRVTVDSAHLRRASLVRGQVPISPGRDTRRFSAQNARYVPRSTGNQRFFSRASNAGPGRNSRGTPSWGGANPGARSFARGGNGTRVAGDSGGWRRFGQPQGSGPGGSRSQVMRSPSYGGSRQPGISGWRRFGEAGPSANRGSALQPRFGGSQGFGNAAPSRQSGGGWHRFGEPSGAARSGALGRQPGAGRVGPSNSGGWQRFENSGRTPGNSNRGNSGAGFSQRQDFQRRIPLSPPVVRERSAPGGGSNRGGFGGGSNRSFDRPSSGGGFNRSYGGGSNRSFDRPSNGGFNRSYGGGSSRGFDRPSSGGFNRSFGGGSSRGFDRPSGGSSGGGGFSRSGGGGGFSRSSGGGFSRSSGGGGGHSGGGSHGGGGRRR